MQEKIFNLLIKMNEKAIIKDEVPVSAIIVKNDKIIAKSYNKRNKKNDLLMHAEIICIKKAIKKMKNWRLNDCELYTTLEPCAMCKSIIEASRIKKVYYLCEKTEIQSIKTKYELISNNASKESKKNLKKFFQNKRNKAK